MSNIKILTYFLFLLLSACLVESAPKPSPTLPRVTDSGTNQAGCYIGQSVFLSYGYRGSLFSLRSYYANYYEDGNKQIIELYENVQSTGKSARTIKLILSGLDSTNYFLKSEQSRVYATLYDGSLYSTDDTHQGFVNIHRNDQRIISGIFEFECAANATVKEVTQGRFDIIKRH